jgi:hypothetical protein
MIQRDGRRVVGKHARERRVIPENSIRPGFASVLAELQNTFDDGWISAISNAALAKMRSSGQGCPLRVLRVDFAVSAAL